MTTQTQFTKALQLRYIGFFVFTSCGWDNCRFYVIVASTFFLSRIFKRYDTPSPACTLRDLRTAFICLLLALKRPQGPKKRLWFSFFLEPSVALAWAIASVVVLLLCCWGCTGRWSTKFPTGPKCLSVFCSPPQQFGCLAAYVDPRKNISKDRTIACLGRVGGVRTRSSFRHSWCALSAGTRWTR